MLRIVLVSAVLALTLAVPTNKLDTIASQFSDWKIVHAKSYVSVEEHNHRLQIFSENVKIIEQHNSEGHSWTMAVNQFADLTPKEFDSLQTLFASKVGTDESPAFARHNQTLSDLPASVDWRTDGLVNDVKNQGQCGSCWAFSTVVSLEGQIAKKTGKLTSFSEQDLVDCVTGETVDGQSCCDGCQGGLMDSAFQYMIDHQGGVDDTEAAYPYKGVDGTCSFNAASAGSVAIKGFTDVAKGNEADLKDAVANVGPISIAVDANMFWQFYHGGVFSPLFCNADKLNHGVAVVGYSGDDYWIIRNSWGASWGEKGYMRMKMGKNVCGVANSASYPTL